MGTSLPIGPSLPLPPRFPSPLHPLLLGRSRLANPGPPPRRWLSPKGPGSWAGAVVRVLVQPIMSLFDVVQQTLRHLQQSLRRQLLQPLVVHFFSQFHYQPAPERQCSPSCRPAVQRSPRRPLRQSSPAIASEASPLALPPQTTIRQCDPANRRQPLLFRQFHRLGKVVHVLHHFTDLVSLA